MRSRFVALLALALGLVAASAWAQPVPGADPEAPGWHHPGFESFMPQQSRLGVQLQDMTPELREFLHAPRDRGVLIVHVDSSSPAERAGLRVGDVVVAVDGANVSETHELVHSVMTAAEQAKLALEIVRDGKSRKLEATLAGEPAMAGPMRWMHDQMPAIEQRLHDLEARVKQLEQQLRASPPAHGKLDT